VLSLEGFRVFKLLFTLGTFLMVALALLALRQHRLELTSQSMKIHDEITAREHTLWDQRVEIARRTNPWALAAGLQKAGVDTGGAMTPRQSANPRAGVSLPAIETDLVAPVRGDVSPVRPDPAPVRSSSGSGGGNGHANPDRPR
jgi:hypothetical protein